MGGSDIFFIAYQTTKQDCAFRRRSAASELRKTAVGEHRPRPKPEAIHSEK
jgi:hypothetical protein